MTDEDFENEVHDMWAASGGTQSRLTKDQIREIIRERYKEEDKEYPND